MSIITFVADIFRGSSCFHVVLIVFLRCLVIVYPMNFKDYHGKLTRISIFGIWIYVIVICLMPTLISTKFLTTHLMPPSYLNAYANSWQALYHGTLTVPILLTIIMYLALIYILKSNRNKENESETNKKKKKSLLSMIQKITIGTLVCYIPFIIWTQYAVAKIKNNTPHEIYNTTGGVS